MATRTKRKRKLGISSVLKFHSKKERAKGKVRKRRYGRFAPKNEVERLALQGFMGVTRKKKVSGVYIKTGISGFDALLGDGIPDGSSVLICGGPGSGKTIFCLQMCHNAAMNGEKCLYMSFEESEDRLRQHMNDFGWDPEKLEKGGKLLIRRFNPFDITRSIEALLTRAKKELLIKVDPVFFPKDFKPSKIVLDSMSAIAAAFVGREDSYRIYIEQLFRFFEELGATSFLVTETENPESMGLTRSGVEGFLADGIIIMPYSSHRGVRGHSIEILKIRGSNFEKRRVMFEIKKNQGIIVHPKRIMK